MNVLPWHGAVLQNVEEAIAGCPHDKQPVPGGLGGECHPFPGASVNSKTVEGGCR